MLHPQFDPVFFSIGPLSIHWYGVMYLVGFLLAQYLAIWRAKRDSWRGFNSDQIQDLLFYCVLGVIIGGRVGYVFFYHFDYFLQNPLYLFKINEGGMSFHGGFLGVVVAVMLFARRNNKTLFQVGDFVAPVVPQGLFFGRLGNFINGELWGRPTDAPWGMIFPQANDMLTRHPSQLYQMAGEGLLLFIILWFYSSKQRPRMAVSAAFMLGYGVLRTAAEFFREPDEHIGYLLGGYLTQGMLLSLPMIIIGGLLLVLAYRKPVYEQATKSSKQKKAKTQK
ncbi:prolipoprotein diacylglyceryl transferase [Reinekea thalattae]|uniref:Phosphatidylglycerol--prolipoprotein diacylglyceryl transferase n=1 Tax=Reinekea thalattae TaxID=2593301 RepID=A0A5C8ZCE1_9GAMM|nr:prolipoprotein diacylglyceryl transferase [Reinekea thalattae]TXR54586.1 prolipoprotein diacylglyceryl transferase [Reinekea thalattae]